MFSVETPHLGDSDENTQYTIFNMKKKTTLNYPKSACSYRIFSKVLKNEFETAVVYEPSVFEPLKFYCIREHGHRQQGDKNFPSFTFQQAT